MSAIESSWDTIKLLAAIVVSVVVLSAIGVGMYFADVIVSLPILLFLLLVLGWVAHAYLRYRNLRQDELLQLMATAADVRMPLPAAIRAYVHDRPHEGAAGDWDILLLFVFPPAYWLWHQRHGFDMRANHLAESIEDGLPLTEAMIAAGGVASRDACVAAAVGQSSGRLAECLRRADRDRASLAWLEVVPRLLYPLLLLLFVTGITAFLVKSPRVMPAIRRIFDDFHYALPTITRHLLDAADDADHWLGPISAILLGIAALVSALIASPAVRWHFPLIRRVYRTDVQGLVLRMLGPLVETGRSIPEALRVLGSAGDWPQFIRRKLDRACAIVESGASLSDALRKTQLLPASMSPMIDAAQRAHTLPWALSQLGELLAGRAARWVRRASAVVGPLLVGAIGVLTALIILGVFYPLIVLLTRLTE